MKKISIGIIGAGGITSSFHLPILKNIENVRVKFIADIINPKGLASIYKTMPITLNGNLDEIPECDIALLAIPVGVREPYLKEFANRGSYILCEKPFAIDIKMHKKFTKYSDHLFCNYHRTMYSNINQIKKIISSHIFGKLKSVKILDGGIIGKFGFSSSSYLNNPKLSGGGILLEWGVHAISQLVHIFENSKIRVDSSNVIFQDLIDVHNKARLIFKNEKREIPVNYKISMIEKYQAASYWDFENSKIIFDMNRPDSSLKVLSKNDNFKFEINPNKKYAINNYQAIYLSWKNIIKNFEKSNKNSEFLNSIDIIKVINEILSNKET